MKEAEKYKKQFFEVSNANRKWAKKAYIDKPPIWCSVDLRDGNQALIIPMSLDEKLEFFKLLVEVGFKEIEVGFPAASDTEYTFLRTLIENNMIPDDVTVQVLTQSRPHIIKKTFEALEGIKNGKAIVHLYNSTSLAQREQVFKKSKKEIIKIAEEGARLFVDMCKEQKVKYRYEYSPESFTGTEPEFALEICNKVLDIWEPSKDNKVVINLPVTVEHSTPNVYADQIEFMNDNLKYREHVIISLHPHNDRGTAVADAELGLLAGADRIEGTLFGNGERTGNVDIVTLALNMYAQGVEPNLDFTNILEIKDLYEKVTRMKVYDRQPYSGKLVFAAFSGSHQDAIAKGMKWREEKKISEWTVPYLPIDPRDLGREYETDVIRINSQSGKGGVSYILENNYSYKLPKKLSEEVSYLMKSVSDKSHNELTPKEIHKVFTDSYINKFDKIKLSEITFDKSGNESIAKLKIKKDGKVVTLVGKGKGKFESVVNAFVSNLKNINISDLTYDEHGITKGADSNAITYLSFKINDGKEVWGVGLDSDILTSSIYALFSAINRALKYNEKKGKGYGNDINSKTFSKRCRI